MKPASLLAIAAVAISVVACNSVAGPGEETKPRHEMKGLVNDYADILTPETEAVLSRDIRQAWTRYGPQLVIVTVPSLEGYSIEDYSLDLARAWGIGGKDRDDGLMMLVAPNDKRVRIEVGRGIEASFTDIFAKRVIEDDILPAFRKGDYERGVIAGTQSLIAKMRTVPTLQTNDNELPVTRNVG